VEQALSALNSHIDEACAIPSLLYKLRDWTDYENILAFADF